MKVYASVEEVKRDFLNVKNIVENGDVYFVMLEEEVPTGKGKRLCEVVHIVPKILSREKIRKVLVENDFSEATVDLVLNGVKRTECVEKLKRALNEGKKHIILNGAVGVGKTTASIWFIAKLLQKRQISNPAYFPFIEKDPFELKKVFQDYDAYVLDDVIPTRLSQAHYALLEIIIYHAERKQKPTLIISNDFEKLKENLTEAILSRLVSSFTWINIKEKKDLRVE